MMGIDIELEQKWEYKVVTLSPKAVDLGESLNRYGNAGWELTAGVPVVESYPGGNSGLGTKLLLIFKRVRRP
jgi:hypothetical protein